jgi:hypothetical protein
MLSLPKSDNPEDGYRALVSSEIDIYVSYARADREFVEPLVRDLAKRDTAGCAAAPAARCKNVRRGSFILNLLSHHSITSSARASSVGGTSRPSVVQTGISAGLAPLRIFPA